MISPLFAKLKDLFKRLSTQGFSESVIKEINILSLSLEEAHKKYGGSLAVIVAIFYDAFDG